MIDVWRVRRVVDNVAIYPSPFSVWGLLGLARFGGEPLTVFSLEVLADLGPSVWKDRRTVVVVEIGGTNPPQRLGLAVDEALKIVSIAETDLSEACSQAVSPPFDLDGCQVRRFNPDALARPSHNNSIARPNTP